MGRVSQAQAQENRQRVVATASRMFREKGTAVSVADLMKAAGLTHGGFYKQFASKEDLVDEAITHAFENPAPYSAAAAVTPKEGEDHEAARQAMIDDYLSIWHRDHAAEGCPVSGFAADLGREPDQAAGAREIYINGVRNRAARLATGDDDGLAQFCTLVGALALARATRGNPLSEELLQAARTALTEIDTKGSERAGSGASSPATTG
ncbi:MULTISPECIES: TetR/AcrR family transcriptional regulator [unclassified Streptomyces]|jgi:TetR/AcrR family transcriptional repressor of nem operon|uniref:TetR/AcrR family transcriptional regulator n=1 Tax=unclassified Streptomyces TaxID=2593676 RepID=UPI00225AD54D|nr:MULTISPECIES: TetR family transcriptional regulator [unclassified Streptomyces]MCX4410055.1 TetR/AcrR family transcriptional regulator [Streptomyces sp. NBC_01764]MCX5191829.1 TetR/AcrR family transcriptional regulator [Streptomyces sp. NBC_00268]